MSNTNNAKIFMPFDALAGFNYEINKKNIEKEKRKILSEDELEIIERDFKKISIKDKLCITYYNKNSYIQKIGIMTKIDYINGKIILDKICAINIFDIIKIERL